MRERKKFNKIRVGIIAGIVLVLSVLILILSYNRSLWEDRAETTVWQTEAETAATVAETMPVPTTAAETEAETTAAVIELPDKEHLVGRIIIEEIGLDDYVMQGDEYLDKDNDGNKALQGSLYLPGYSTGECIFINGHTMKDGSRFGTLYKQRDNLTGMKVILQYEGVEREFEIIKTYIVSGTDEHAVKALFTGGYKEYLKEFWDLEVDGTVLSLMCCEYSLKDGRLFAVAEEIR